MDLNFFNNNALGYSPAVDADAFGLNGCGLRQYNQAIELDNTSRNLGFVNSAPTQPGAQNQAALQRYLIIGAGILLLLVIIILIFRR